MDLATGHAPAEPSIDYGVPRDYPALSSDTRMRAVWRLDGSGPTEGRQRLPSTTFEGRYNLAFKVAPGPEGDGYGVSMMDCVFAAGHTLGEARPRLDMSPVLESTYTGPGGWDRR